MGAAATTADRQTRGMTGRILIVDDVATNRIVLKARLAAALHEVHVAPDGQTALRMIRSDPPDAVLLDLGLPDISGLEVLASLRADPAYRDLPVIIHSAEASPEQGLAALRAGADDVLAKPADDRLLLARLRALLRRRDPDARNALSPDGLRDEAMPFDWPGLVSVTTFRPDAARRLTRLLGPLLPHRLALRNRESLLGADSPRGDGGPGTPDSYLIDGTDDVTAALVLLSELRSDSLSRHAGIALLVPDVRMAAFAYDLGADEAIFPTAPPEEMAARLDALVRRARAVALRRAELHDHARLALTDPLTGLANRRHALRRLGELSALSVSSGQGFSVLLADLDRFKSVNDGYGHAAGDAVLAEIANRLSAEMHPGDLLARIGGEEFLIALPAARPAEGEARARRLCAAVGGRPVTLPDGRQISVTLSVGLAHARPGTLPEAVMDQADRALLGAKMQGRNRVALG